MLVWMWVCLNLLPNQWLRNNYTLCFHTYCKWWPNDFSVLGLTAGGWWLGTGGFGSTAGTNSPGLPSSLGALGSASFSTSWDSLGLLPGRGGGVRGERFKLFSLSHASGGARTCAGGRGSGGRGWDPLPLAGFLNTGRGGTGGGSSLISGKLLLGGGGGSGAVGLPA